MRFSASAIVGCVSKIKTGHVSNTTMQQPGTQHSCGPQTEIGQCGITSTQQAKERNMQAFHSSITSTQQAKERNMQAIPQHSDEEPTSSY